MKKQFFLLSFALLGASGAMAQSHSSLDTIKPPASYENIWSRPIGSDSLASSFVIYIKKEVKAHKHAAHTEHVYVLEGTGEMMIGDKKVKVKKGDILFIPKGTPHSLKVTSSKPCKVLSVQSPMFDGKDRVFIE